MRPHPTIVAFAAIFLLGGPARADEITVYSVDNRTPGTKFDNVAVLAIRGENVVFRTSGGEERERPLKSVFKLAINSDLALTAAENAYIDKQWDKAIDGYQKVVRGGGDAWKTVYAVPRLLEAAEKTKRFDAALAGYIGLARVDAVAASAIRPALPAKGSKFLDDAAKDLDIAARQAVKAPEKQALLSLLLDVQLARADQTGAEATVDQLLTLAGPNTDDPQLAGMVAGIRLGQARVAFEAKRWLEVTKAIDAAAPRLIDPKLQAEALYLRASAMLGVAKADDKPARMDAAIAFMRVVAHFADTEGKPFVGQSLLGAADALESVGDINAARTLCEQTIAELPDTPHATEAARRVARFPKKS